MNSLIFLLFLINQPGPLQKMFLRRNPELIIRALAMEPRVQEKVGLSEDEINFFKDIYFETRKTTERIKSEIRLREIELEEVMQSEKIDFDKAEKLIKELGDLNTELRLNQIRSFRKIYEELGEKRFNEIREKLKEIKPERRFPGSKR